MPKWDAFGNSDKTALLPGGLLGGTLPLPYWHAKPDSPEGPKALIVMLEVTWGN